MTTTTLYIASYNTRGEDGVLGAFTSLAAAQEACDLFYGVATPTDGDVWEHEPAWSGDRDWPESWHYTYNSADDEYGRVTVATLVTDDIAAEAA